MTPLNITIAVVVFVIMDLVVLGAIFYGVSGAAREIAERHPSRPVLSGAVRREFQTVGIGLGNWGKGYHLTVDEQHLHMEPAWLLRKLGVKPASVPWEGVRLGRRYPSIHRSEAEIAGKRVFMPPWALELAQASA